MKASRLGKVYMFIDPHKPNAVNLKGLNETRLIIRRRKKEILSENLLRKSRLLLKFNDYNTIIQPISQQRNHTPNKENKYIGNLIERRGEENK